MATETKFSFPDPDQAILDGEFFIEQSHLYYYHAGNPDVTPEMLFALVNLLNTKGYAYVQDKSNDKTGFENYNNSKYFANLIQTCKKQDKYWQELARRNEIDATLPVDWLKELLDFPTQWENLLGKS